MKHIKPLLLAGVVSFAVMGCGKSPAPQEETSVKETIAATERNPWPRRMKPKQLSF